MSIHVWHEDSELISGLWKFRSGVGLIALQQMALEWKHRDPDYWERLYIRGAGRDGALGIGFEYRLSYSDLNHRDRKVAATLFFNEVTDELKRRFGNDFHGYDYSYPTWVLHEM